MIPPGPIFLETTNLWRDISLTDSGKLWSINLSPHLNTPKRPWTTPTSSLTFILHYQGSWELQSEKVSELKIPVLKDRQDFILDNLLFPFLSTTQRNSKGKLKVRMLTLMSTNQHLMRIEQTGKGGQLTKDSAPAPPQLMSQNVFLSEKPHVNIPEGCNYSCDTYLTFIICPSSRAPFLQHRIWHPNTLLLLPSSG